MVCAVILSAAVLRPGKGSCVVEESLFAFQFAAIEAALRSALELKCRTGTCAVCIFSPSVPGRAISGRRLLKFVKQLICTIYARCIHLCRAA